MQTSSLIRWSGLAAILGGTLWVAKVLYEMNDENVYVRDITDYMFFVVPLLLLAGLTGLYALGGRSSGRRGQGGLIGFFLGVLGLLAISVSFGPWTLGLLPLGRAKVLPLALGFMSILATA